MRWEVRGRKLKVESRRREIRLENNNLHSNILQNVGMFCLGLCLFEIIREKEII